jgi:hypothetical protein
MALRMIKIGWVLEARRPWPSQIQLKGEDPPDFQRYPDPPFGGFLTLIRVLVSGFPYVSFTSASPACWMYPGKRGTGAMAMPPASSKLCLLESRDLESLAEVWTAGGQAALECKEAWWRASIVHFNKAYSLFAPDDRLVNLCVSLEACLSGRKEVGKGRKIATRAVRLLGSNADLPPVHETIEAAFETRNRILHPAELSLSAGLVDNMFAVTRAILREILVTGQWKESAPPSR